MKKLYDEFSRRNLLRYLGNSVLFLPMIRTFSETQVFGQEAAQKRAVFFYFPSGIIRNDFFPDVGNLSALPKMTAPLADVKDDIIVLRDTAYVTEGSHQGGMNYALTGLSNSKEGISIDTYLGEKFKSTKQVVRLGVASRYQGGAEPQSASFDTPGHAAVRENNPTKAFRDLFGGAAPVPTATGMAPATTPMTTSGLTNASKKNLLDDNLEQINALQKKLGSIEKQKLNSHLEAINEMQRQLAALGNPTTGGGTGGGTVKASSQCTRTINQTQTFGLDESASEGAFGQPAAYNAVADMMNEIAIQALACRVTNVLLLQHGHSVLELPFSNGKPGAGQGQHSTSHYKAEGNIPGHIANQAYMMGKLRNLIYGLSQCKEGDKSVLYNSIVMGFSELGDSDDHDMKNVGIILAGQAGGYFKTGRCVSGGNASHNQTLVSILQSFGLPDMTIGDKAAQGPLAVLRG